MAQNIFSAPAVARMMKASDAAKASILTNSQLLRIPMEASMRRKAPAWNRGQGPSQGKQRLILIAFRDPTQEPSRARADA